MQLAVRQQHLILDLFLTERMKLNNFVLNLQTEQRFSFVILYRMCNYISNTLAPSTRWRNTWGRSLSVMATLPTTLCMRTWWRIFLPKRMRTKTASYPPESSLTSTMNFKVSLCAAAHSGSLSVLFFISSWLQYFGVWNLLQACSQVTWTSFSFIEALCLCGVCVCVWHVNSSRVKICVVGFEPTGL